MQTRPRIGSAMVGSPTRPMWIQADCPAGAAGCGVVSLRKDHHAAQAAKHKTARYPVSERRAVMGQAPEGSAARSAPATELSILTKNSRQRSGYLLWLQLKIVTDPEPVYFTRATRSGVPV